MYIQQNKCTNTFWSFLPVSLNGNIHTFYFYHIITNQLELEQVTSTMESTNNMPPRNLLKPTSYISRYTNVTSHAYLLGVFLIHYCSH